MILQHGTTREGRFWRIPWLFYAFSNGSGYAGHARLLGSRPGRGWAFFTWHGFPAGWSRRRCWNFVLFAVHHIDDEGGTLKSTEPGGWHLTFASLEIRRIYSGFSVSWRNADTYRVKP